MIRNQTVRKLMVAGFVAALWLPLIALVVGPPQAVSESEKRQLASFPDPGVATRSLRAYTQALEEFYNDHFGFRETLIRWFNYVQVKWLGIPNSQWVLVGEDGWLFQGGQPHLADMRNTLPFGPGELAHWARVLSEKQDWLNAQGIAYLFVIAPNKHTIYGSHLPASVNRVGALSRTDQLVAHLRAHTQVQVLDLRTPVRDAAARMRTHHKTDTHWNAFGAYVGYRTIMDALADRLPDARVVRLQPDDFHIRRTPGGDLAQVLNMRDAFPEESVEPRSPVRDCAVDETLDPGADDRVRNQEAFATTCAAAGHRLLMFRDSYALAMMPYLSESFGYAYYVPASPVPLAAMRELVREHLPDIVVEQRASRWLRTPEG